MPIEYTDKWGKTETLRDNITPEQRNAMLSGDKKIYEAYLMEHEPEYRNAIIAQKKAALDRAQKEYDSIKVNNDPGI